MPKRILVTDTHIHTFAEFSNTNRVRRSLDAWYYVFDQCAKLGITSMIHLGDVFHSRQSAKFEYFNETFGFLKSLCPLGFNLDIIVGNHDQVNKDGSLTTIDTFSGFCNIHKEFSKIFENVYVVPYRSSTEEIISQLKQIPDGAIVLAHIDILGAEAGANWISTHGITIEELNRFKLFVSGHYHKRQQLAPNAYYMGATTPQNFTEASQPGYFCILDDDTGEITWEICPAPRFEIIQNISQVDGSLRNCYVRIDSQPSDEIEGALIAVEALGWKYNPPPMKVVVKERSSGLNLNTDLGQVVTLFSNVQSVDAKLDPAIVNNVGQDILRSVLG